MTTTPEPRWPVALVTGASSGIGRAFAVALGRRGTRVIAVARRGDRLEAVARELGGGTEVIVADLTTPEGLAPVEERLRDGSRPVDLLVNNAGFGGSGPFVDQPVDREEREVRLNVLAPVRLTHAALGGMLERRHGGVVNVSSIAGVQPVPFMATYAATKAYLTSFSQSLHEEVRDRGVSVVALLPGMTRTEFHQASGLDRSMVPGPAWISAEEVADSALRAVEAGRPVCVPRLSYRLLATASRVAPLAVNRRISRMVGRRL